MKTAMHLLLVEYLLFCDKLASPVSVVRGHWNTLGEQAHGPPAALHAETPQISMNSDKSSYIRPRECSRHQSEMYIERNWCLRDKLEVMFSR